MSYSYPALPPILHRVSALGLKVFSGSEAYDLNIIGIRSPEKTANAFDDLICCAYREEKDGPWVVRCWPATTDPGTYWLDNPSRVDGTAILVPGQYRGVYKIDKHGGKYEALCQRNGDVSVYRDNNRDATLDADASSIVTGMFGINIHHAGQNSTRVDKWSAGCQVFARMADFDEFMGIVKQQIAHHPTWESFTYTLIEEW